jgi:hypothetical protein
MDGIGKGSELLWKELRPNTRMQPDAATRPQDRCYFENWLQLNWLPDLLWRRG